MNKNRLTSLLLLSSMLMLLFAVSGNAIDFISEDNINISNIHEIEGDLYVWGNNVTIDGEVNGDMTGGGFQVVTNGEITNSANIFANDYTHNGYINGSMRLFAYSADIDGNIGRSLLAACNTLKIGKEAVIEDDSYLSGGVINFDGTINNNLTIACGTVYLTGTIEGDLEIHAEKINILAPALIKGDFKYVSDKEANIDTESGVTILGNLTWDLPEEDGIDTDSTFSEAVLTCSKFLAAFLFGIIIMLLGKKYINEMVYQLQNRMAVSLAVGMLSSFIFLVSIIVLLTALILLIVSLSIVSKGGMIGGGILFVLSSLLIPISSFAMVSGGVVLYGGKIVVGLLIGYLVFQKINSNTKYLSRTQLFVGLMLLYLSFSIPYLGFLIVILIMFAGAGAMVLGFKHCSGEKKISGSDSSIGQ